MSRLSSLIDKEIRSTASVSFFVVMALAIMASVQWYEGQGGTKHAQAAVAGTSTTAASLPVAATR